MGVVRPVVALAPLLAAYAGLTAVTQPPASPVYDEGPLLDAARRLVDGGYAARAMDEVAYLWHGPGLPALLSPLVALDMPVPLQRYLMPLLLFAAVLAITASCACACRRVPRWPAPTPSACTPR